MSNVTNPRLDELPQVFRLLFSRRTPSEQESRLHDALTMVDEGHIDPEGIFIARTQHNIRGAVVALPLPGAGAIFWTPVVKDGCDRAQVEDRLMQSALDWLRRGSTKVAHALLYLDESSLAAPLLRNGFRQITRLQYLQRTLAEAPLTPPFPPGEGRPAIQFRTYAETSPETFHSILAHTYEDSLDCPELNGLRTLDEIMAGHLAQCDNNPQLWWMACAPQPVGVIMLADMPAWESWDISYLGVAPAARRQGIARQLVQLAMSEALSAGVPELTVAVDTRNAPAWNLYSQLGFQPGEQREVYLAKL